MEKPKIRFKGYQEDWEQRKLNEIADKVSEKNKNNEFSEPFTNSAEQGIISQKDYFDREIVNNENLNGYYIVRNDDFIYNPRISVTAPVGPINRNRLGRNGVMSPLYTVFRTHDIDNLYLEFYFKTTRWHRFMKLNGDSGVRFDRFTISSTQFMEMPIPYPTLEEQQKIGEYFESLDHLITLHQRKCEEMKTLKKYMLQKMFPQNGQLVPQIRFSGFTEDWEQRKFSELCDMVTVGIANSATHAYSDSGIVMFRNQNIKPNFLDDNDIIHIKPEFESRYKNKRLKKNDLLVARTGYPGTACVVPEKYENSQTFTTLIARPKNSVNPYFLCQYLNSDIGVKYFESTQIGGGQKNSGAGILNEMPVMLPSGIEEESKIAEYFTNFDHLITLHQQKCDELRNIKKFMLQNMFI